MKQTNCKDCGKERNQNTYFEKSPLCSRCCKRRVINRKSKPKDQNQLIEKMWLKQLKRSIEKND